VIYENRVGAREHVPDLDGPYSRVTLDAEIRRRTKVVVPGLLPILVEHYPVDAAVCQVALPYKTEFDLPERVLLGACVGESRVRNVLVQSEKKMIWLAA